MATEISRLVIKYINHFRSVLMRSITKYLTKSQYPSSYPNDADDIKRILICRPNHRLGNLLLLTPLLQEIERAFPNCKIDLFVRGTLAATLFKNYKNVDRIMQLPKKPFRHLSNYVKVWKMIRKQQYDLAINVSESSASGRLSTKFAKAKHRIYNAGTYNIYPNVDYHHMGKNPVYNFKNYMCIAGHTYNDTRIPSLNIRLSDSELAEGKTRLQELVDNNKGTICLYTYATGPKCYSLSWWATFYERLKLEYPDYNIIEILPLENESKLLFKAPAFIRKIAALIANADLFIGGDSGIMHLANAAQTPTVGLFSITDIETYQPYGNNSLAINTTTSTIDDWFAILNSLMDSCETIQPLESTYDSNESLAVY